MKDNSLVQNLRLLRNLPKSWIILHYDKVLKDCSSGNEKILNSDFLDSGKYAIVDQGKELIAGYSNESKNIVNQKPPFIIFGDHTRIVKFINFSFVMGADGIKVLKVVNETMQYEKYLYYFLMTLNIPDTGYNRHYKYLKDIQIPLPPLDTQKKIAAILDAADVYRQKTKTLIEKYDQLTQSLFLDMFGDPQTNIKLWKTVDFGDHIDILTDYHANGSYENLNEHVDLKNTLDYALMIRTTDLERKNFEGDVICISESAYHFLKKTKVYGGEIIINKIGSAGKVYLMPKLNRPVSLGMNAFMLRLKNSLNHIFAYFLLKSQYGEQEIQKRVQGAVTKTIRKDAVRAIPIIVPPITLQNQFAERIQLIEGQKQQAQASLQKAEDLFNSLLQKAFKGELVED